jgi:hypothetical protein
LSSDVCKMKRSCEQKKKQSNDCFLLPCSSGSVHIKIPSISILKPNSKTVYFPLIKFEAEF